jgi:hypothetical protein
VEGTLLKSFLRKALAMSVLVGALSGCATEIVMLKNPHTGQVARCGGERGGSIAGGMIGYSLQESDKDDCVRDYQAQGFKRVPPAKDLPEQIKKPKDLKAVD